MQATWRHWLHTTCTTPPPLAWHEPPAGHYQQSRGRGMSAALAAPLRSGKCGTCGLRTIFRPSGQKKHGEKRQMPQINESDARRDDPNAAACTAMSLCPQQPLLWQAGGGGCHDQRISAREQNEAWLVGFGSSKHQERPRYAYLRLFGGLTCHASLLHAARLCPWEESWAEGRASSCPSLPLLWAC